MEEDIDTRKINNSFLRDHSYATEGAKGEPKTENSGPIMKHELSR
ncbi:PPP2R2B isoform 16 [Pan troglodytes]|uniref:Protein phosphatase 2 regulatory subunit Bbeta n=2 Tax=Homininae TaxID=207598 RepID=E9PCT7_HUMAN|nr:PPP2R2B isoform 10 [Pan troglodytes]PNI71796.1 PPP2R2B isoform 13 [Pan troglodytes]PNI71799.1 PPP2R2B isoform 16 [Pan troglodytes]